MADEIKMTVPDMIRQTANNSSEFMKQIAEHIEKLEDGIIKLQTRIEELEKQNVINNSAQ